MTNGSESARADANGYDELRIEDFARLFGTTVGNIPKACRELIENCDFRYKRLQGRERDRVLVEVFKRLDSDQFTTAGKEGKGRWDKGWSENLERFIKDGHDISALVPKYIRPNQPLRLDQGYMLPVDPNFEFNWYQVFRLWLLDTYLADVEAIYEFGCGSGFNLATLAHLYPKKAFYGLDWAEPSVAIVNEMAKAYGWNMKGILFDFFAPNEKVIIADNSAVLTVGALEQTGTDYGSFLQYLLGSRPKLCVHVEPILEWYDENNLVDYAAIKFHQIRRYWQEFPNRLRALELEGKVEIIKTKRSFFGSLYLEGYSQLIWRPRHGS